MNFCNVCTNRAACATGCQVIRDAENAKAMARIPIHLPSGGIALLYVPVRLTTADAERIAAFVRALTVGEPSVQPMWNAPDFIKWIDS